MMREAFLKGCVSTQWPSPTRASYASLTLPASESSRCSTPRPALTKNSALLPVFGM